MGDPQRRLTLTKQSCLGVARQPMKVPSGLLAIEAPPEWARGRLQPAPLSHRFSPPSLPAPWPRPQTPRRPNLKVFNPEQTITNRGEYNSGVMGQSKRPTCPECGAFLTLALPPGGKGQRTFQCLDCNHDRPDDNG
jgi:hypothetical protein